MRLMNRIVVWNALRGEIVSDQGPAAFGFDLDAQPQKFGFAAAFDIVQVDEERVGALTTGSGILFELVGFEKIGVCLKLLTHVVILALNYLRIGSVDSHHRADSAINILYQGIVQNPEIARMTGTKTAIILAHASDLREAGFAVVHCLVGTSQEIAEQLLRDALDGESFGLVMIGGGIRMIPEHTELFERIVNVVLEESPGIRLCFNTAPDNTVEALRRWITPRP